MFKGVLYLFIISLFQACTYKSTIQSGDYSLNKKEIEASIYPLPIAIKKLYIDTHTQQVTFSTNYITITSKAKRLEEKKWFQDCYTNTSHNILETWELIETQLGEKLYLSASCDPNIVLLFNPQRKDAYYKATSYKKPTQLPIDHE
jgi:hypothetical protein